MPPAKGIELMVDRRKPLKTPGLAKVEATPSDSFDLPATLWYGAVRFYASAIADMERQDQHAQQQSLLGALYMGFAFFEATINQVAFAHAASHRNTLPEMELDVLEEKETTIDQKGNVIRRIKYYPFEARFSFVCQFLSGKDFDRATPLWSRLKEVRALRDVWAHPKPPFDTRSLSADSVRSALTTLREALAEISKMMEVEPPLWLVEFDQAYESSRDVSGQEGRN